jgi:hypothetical protein
VTAHTQALGPEFDRVVKIVDNEFGIEPAAGKEEE